MLRLGFELCECLLIVTGIIIIIIIFLFYYYYFINPRKNEGGKKLRKVQRGLKWKTSPGGPQRENHGATIRR